MTAETNRRNLKKTFDKLEQIKRYSAFWSSDPDFSKRCKKK